MVVKIYKEFTMMDFMFVQTPMVNVVKMMKSVFSVMNCYLGSKYADSTKFKDQRETGTLFLVPTPIGNRDDMSYRMIQTLKE